MSAILPIADRLAAPFPADVIGWKPQAVTGSRALAIAYVDARAIMARLDETMGPENWCDRYRVLDGGCVECRLSLRIDNHWITKVDVGTPSDQQDPGDRLKSAYSDSLKRAGVKWSISRYLYDLPSQWCDWDAQRKCFKGVPKLPDWAVPGAAPRTATAAAPPAAAHPEPVIHAQDLDDDESDKVEQHEQHATGRITDNQERQLVELLRTTGANINRFLQHFGIRSVGSLPQADFPRAVTMSRQKAASTIGKAVDRLQARDAAVNGVDAAKGHRGNGKP